MFNSRQSWPREVGRRRRRRWRLVRRPPRRFRRRHQAEEAPEEALFRRGISSEILALRRFLLVGRARLDGRRWRLRFRRFRRFRQEVREENRAPQEESEPEGRRIRLDGHEQGRQGGARVHPFGGLRYQQPVFLLSIWFIQWCTFKEESRRISIIPSIYFESFNMVPTSVESLMTMGIHWKFCLSSDRLQFFGAIKSSIESCLHSIDIADTKLEKLPFGQISLEIQQIQWFYFVYPKSKWANELNNL